MPSTCKEWLVFTTSCCTSSANEVLVMPYAQLTD